MSKEPFPYQALLQWFEEHQRLLPWRQSPSPYSVWVSEVMLQQTKAETVIPYFKKWMDLFPTIEALAKAQYEVVLKAWEGLGYYNRVRHLHAGAKEICKRFGGVFPEQKKELEKIRGIGPYTVGAILSFAFGVKTPCIDGNVTRVLSRYFLVQKEVDSSNGRNKVWKLAEKMVQMSPSHTISEALIELGALICQKKPRCDECPIKRGCLAYKRGMVDKLPKKREKIVYENKVRIVLVIRHKEEVLVKRCGPKEIMEDLHEFPYVDGDKEDEVTFLLEKWGISTTNMQKLPKVKQFFTRFRFTLYPRSFQVEKMQKIPGYFWISLSEIGKLSFSSGHRKILENLLKL